MSLINKFFANKILTNEEILEKWKSSNKSFASAESILAQLPDKVLMNHIHTIEIKNSKEFKSLINFLKKRQSTIFSAFLNNAEFLLEYFLISPFDYSSAFLNKFELIGKLINTAHSELIMRHFFNKRTFIDSVRYSIIKNDIEFLKFFIKPESLTYLLDTDYKIMKSNSF
jgi:hypothetical protein